MTTLLTVATEHAPWGPRPTSVHPAKKLIDKKILVQSGGDLGQGWADGLVAQLLYREAEALLASKKHAKSEGNKEP